MSPQPVFMRVFVATHIGELTLLRLTKRFVYLKEPETPSLYRSPYYLPFFRKKYEAERLIDAALLCRGAFSKHVPTRS